MHQAYPGLPEGSVGDAILRGYRNKRIRTRCESDSDSADDDIDDVDRQDAGETLDLDAGEPLDLYAASGSKKSLVGELLKELHPRSWRVAEGVASAPPLGMSVLDAEGKNELSDDPQVDAEDKRM